MFGSAGSLYNLDVGLAVFWQFGVSLRIFRLLALCELWAVFGGSPVRS